MSGLRNLALAVCWLALPAVLRGAATESPPVDVVPKWDRFEKAFRSSVLYSNALQDATLTVLFTSPLGETNLVYGFWDGERTWKVRFSPNQVGRWTFKTTCSDASNRGLHGHAGEFICSAPIGQNPFHRHGPVQVALDHRHLEHADGTPFFWLADTTWNGPHMASDKDWEFYAAKRAQQHFTVVQWAVAPGHDPTGEAAVGGFPDQIAISPAFFRKLDARLETVTEAGLLSAIVPLLELDPRESGPDSATDDQVALLARYVVARWGAEPVVWVLAFNGSDRVKLAERWRRIGQAVFGGISHAPVMVYPGAALAALQSFRDQGWVNLFGGQCVTGSSDEALLAAQTGPFAHDWPLDPPRPLIPFLPRENGLIPQTDRRFSADEVRRAAYWGLLLSPPAGLSYAGQSLVDWDGAMQVLPVGSKNQKLPHWKTAMFMPAAKQMAFVADALSSVQFWRLRPRPNALGPQPTPNRSSLITAASAETKDLALVYVPDAPKLELVPDALPPTPALSWLNPRTGQTNPAAAVLQGNLLEFPTPAPGDWLLVVRAGKR